MFGAVTQVPNDLPNGYITPERAKRELEALCLAPNSSHPTSALVLLIGNATTLRTYLDRNGFRHIIYGFSNGVIANQRNDQDFTGVAPISAIVYVSERTIRPHHPFNVPILYPHPGPPTQLVQAPSCVCLPTPLTASNTHASIGPPLDFPDRPPTPFPLLSLPR